MECSNQIERADDKTTATATAIATAGGGGGMDPMARCRWVRPLSMDPFSHSGLIFFDRKNISQLARVRRRHGKREGERSPVSFPNSLLLLYTHADTHADTDRHIHVNSGRNESARETSLGRRRLTDQ